MPSPDTPTPDTPILPYHRLRPGRCPHLVNVNGLLVRCERDRHDSATHFWSGDDYINAEKAARAAGWKFTAQLRADATLLARARELATSLLDSIPSPESTRWRRSYEALLDLLTGETDD